VNTLDICRALLLFGACRDAVDVLGRRPLELLPAPGMGHGFGSHRDGGAQLELLLGSAPHVPNLGPALGQPHLHIGGPAAVGAPPMAVAGGGGVGPFALGNVTSAQDPTAAAWASDEFQMYEFKVRRCTRTRAHDWTECPFTHPGEKARRRDPRVFAYSGSACPDFRKGACRRGDSCEWAHGVFECWLHPTRYRTQTCKDGPACSRRVCFFAHLPGELRAPTMPSPMPAGSGVALGLCGDAPAGSASPERPPLPHSSSDSSTGTNDTGSNGSPPRSASPPRALETFAELAAYGLITGPRTSGGDAWHYTSAHAAQPPRRGASVDGGARPLPRFPGAADELAAAERQMAALSMAASSGGALYAAARAMPTPPLINQPEQHTMNAAHAAAAHAVAAAAAAAAAAAVHHLPGSSSGASASAMLAQQAALQRAVAHHRAALASQHQQHGAGQETAGYDTFLGAAMQQQQQHYRAPPSHLTGAAARVEGTLPSFPRPSSFAHLGLVEDLLDEFGASHEQLAAWA